MVIKKPLLSPWKQLSPVSWAVQVTSGWSPWSLLFLVNGGGAHVSVALWWLQDRKKVHSTLLPGGEALRDWLARVKTASLCPAHLVSAQVSGDNEDVAQGPRPSRRCG